MYRGSKGQVTCSQMTIKFTQFLCPSKTVMVFYKQVKFLMA